MWFSVVGGTMLALNALSGAAYHYERFGDDANPGIYLYAAFFTFYTLDYFIFERVQLYTYDLIHERLGFMLFWGGLVVYGWLFILPLWGMAAYPDPGFSTGWTYVWLIGTGALFLLGWSISRGANLQKYTFKRWPDRKFLGLIEPKYIEVGDRKILYTGFWGVARHFNCMGEGFLSLSIALVFGHFTNLWAWNLLRLHRHALHLPSTRRRQALRRKVRPREVGGVQGTSQVPHLPRRLLSERPAEPPPRSPSVRSARPRAPALASTRHPASVGCRRLRCERSPA